MTERTKEEACLLRHSKMRQPLEKMHYGKAKLIRLEPETKRRMNVFIAQFGHRKDEDAVATLLNMLEDELGRPLIPKVK